MRPRGRNLRCFGQQRFLECVAAFLDALGLLFPCHGQQLPSGSECFLILRVFHFSQIRAEKDKILLIAVLIYRNEPIALRGFPRDILINLQRLPDDSCFAFGMGQLL
jgi:hypothetical protein